MPVRRLLAIDRLDTMVVPNVKTVLDRKEHTEFSPIGEFKLRSKKKRRKEEDSDSE